MLPIYYNTAANAGAGEWQKADNTKVGNSTTYTTDADFNTNHVWYNYATKKWANAVTLTSSSLQTYKDAVPGTTINDSDVLGYWVYIPRYRYKVQRCQASDQAIDKAMAFDIEFENKDTLGYTKAFPAQKGDWATHPAFTFASDADKRSGNIYATNELNGIWIGKYETTGSATAPTIKPSPATPLVNQNVSTQFTTAKTMGKVDNTGLIHTDLSTKNTHNFNSAIDARMAKNDDWGAAAYLATSRIGNNTIEIMDTTAGTDKTSTTGNKYGVYNLGGGDVYEMVMAVYNQTVASSGFNTTTSPLPDAQYYNNYTFTDLTSTSCNFANCGGQALRETTGWNRDAASAPTSSSPWMSRGGMGQVAFSGLFSYHAIGTGVGDNATGFRTVLHPMVSKIVKSYPAGQSFLTVSAASGDNFAMGTKILVDGQLCTNTTFISPTKITCNTPALTGLGDQPVTIVPPPTSVGDMQGWAGCSTMSIGDKVVLRDTRNDQNYRVRKMEDGHCWMIDNMKLADVTLHSSDSKVASDYNLMAVDNSTTGLDYDTPYLKDPTTGSTERDNCIYGTTIDPDSLTGCGYLYSWSAATAGTGDGISSGNASGSICPSGGWHLPTGTATGEFAVLNGSMLAGAPATASTANTDDSRSNWWATGPFSGAYSGFFSGSTWGNQGDYSRWWSSTANTSEAAYEVAVYYNHLSPGTGAFGRYLGLAVRCIL
jgi:uncharacterized protein (TIGR02145 family)